MIKITEGMDTVATLVIVIVLCCSSTIKSTVTLPDCKYFIFMLVLTNAHGRVCDDRGRIVFLVKLRFQTTN